MFKASLYRMAVVRPNNTVAFVGEVVGVEALREMQKYVPINFDGEVIEINLGRTREQTTGKMNDAWTACCKQPQNTTRADIMHMTLRLQDFQ